MWLRFGCLILLMGTAMPCYAESDNVVQWRKDISARLVAGRRFPPEARGEAGSARVRFVLDRSGKLVSSWLEESTGSAILDAEALAMIERAQPFPVAPPEMDELNFALPVNFNSRRPPAIDPLKEADIRKQDTAVREENSAINAKMRSICRGC